MAETECCAGNGHAGSRGKRRALRIKDGRAAELAQHAIERRDWINGCAVIVAQDRGNKSAVGPMTAMCRAVLNGRAPLFLEQYDALLRGFQGRLAVTSEQNVGVTQAIQWIGALRVKEPQLEAAV